MSVAAEKAGTAGRPGLSDRKRAAILEGARSIFLDQGFGSASMDAVAARAGVSKMTVYRHFGSKEDLFAGVITDLCERIVTDDIEEIFTREPREALRGFARKMTDIVFAQDTVELHRIVIAESRRFPKLGALFYDTGPQACIDALEAYFIRNLGDRRFKVTEPRRAAEEFLELLRGYAHLRMMLGIDKGPSAAEIDARIEGAVGLVMA